MRDGVNAIFAWGVLAALLLPPVPALADPGPEGPAQEGESRWVPSLAITSGVTFQKQEGAAESELIRGANPVPVALQPRCDPTADPSCNPIPLSGDDVTAAPFVGAALEVMSPAVPIPTRPRFFVSAEVLPTFGSEHALSLQGASGCVRGPEPEDPCAVDEDGSRRNSYSETNANGQGIETNATVDTLVYGAGLGVAFPLWLNEWQLRIKPSFAWTSYAIDATGLVVHAACNPPTRCVTSTPVPGQPPVPGFLRQPESLQASATRRFDAIGPGLDIEVDTGRFGPIGTSLFLGGRAFYTLGDRTISFGTTQVYNDQVGNDVVNARFEVGVNDWMFRTQLGMRFHWLGNKE